MVSSLPSESQSILPKKETPLDAELTTERSTDLPRNLDRGLRIELSSMSESMLSLRSSSDKVDSDVDLVSSLSFFLELLLVAFDFFNVFDGLSRSSVVTLDIALLVLSMHFSLRLFSFFIPLLGMRLIGSLVESKLSERLKRETSFFKAVLLLGLDPLEDALMILSVRFKDDLLLDLDPFEDGLMSDVLLLGLDPLEDALMILSVRFKLFCRFNDFFVDLSFDEPETALIALPLPRLRNDGCLSFEDMSRELGCLFSEFLLFFLDFSEPPSARVFLLLSPSSPFFIRRAGFFGSSSSSLLPPFFLPLLGFGRLVPKDPEDVRISVLLDFGLSLSSFLTLIIADRMCSRSADFVALSLFFLRSSRDVLL